MSHLKATSSTTANTPHLEADFLRLSEVVSAMTYALDITEGQPEGHTLRSCIIGMRIARALNLNFQQCSDLYYALLLKDLGCSTTASKVREIFDSSDQTIKVATKTVNFHNKLEGMRFLIKHVAKEKPFFIRVQKMFELAFRKQHVHAELTQTRCERGADIALAMGFSDKTASAIRALDEHWNGKGRPYNLKAEAIPLLARILCLAQTVAVFYQQKGAKAALKMAKTRAGSWFDPAIVAAFETAQEHPLFWAQLEDSQLEQQVRQLEPDELIIRADEHKLDSVAEAFAQVIDAKSPWTYKHSARVRQLTLGAAAQLSGEQALSDERLKRLSRAALLHDIGKLGVSNLILDKPDQLSSEEFLNIQSHPTKGENILSRIKPFTPLVPLIASHHERIDGKGYPQGIPAGQLDFEVRLLTVADQFEALTSQRPYRQALSKENALLRLREGINKSIDPIALDALERFLATPEAAPLLETQLGPN